MQKYFFISLLTTLFVVFGTDMTLAQSGMTFSSNQGSSLKRGGSNNESSHLPRQNGTQKSSQMKRGGAIEKKGSEITRGGTESKGQYTPTKRDHQTVQHRTCEKQIATYEKELGELQRELFLVKKELATNRQQNARREVETLRRQLTATKTELTASKKRVHQLESNLSTARQRRTNLSEELEQCEDYSVYLNDKLDEYRGKKTRVRGKGGYSKFKNAYRTDTERPNYKAVNKSEKYYREEKCD